MKKILFTLSVCFFLFSGNVLAQGKNVYSGATAPGVKCPATVKDYDNNQYKTVLIGKQCWMKQNLRATHYSDGTPIPLGSQTSTSTAYRYYPNNSSSNVSTYGYLYNWKAVMRNSNSSNRNPSGVQGICPAGWHVPSNAEWAQLVNYLGSQSRYVCGGNSDNTAKALAATSGWSNSSNTCAVGNTKSGNNGSGFTAVPAGGYYNSYAGFGSGTGFWSATTNDNGHAYYRGLRASGACIYDNHCGLANGFSVRCIRN